MPTCMLSKQLCTPKCQPTYNTCIYHETTSVLMRGLEFFVGKSLFTPLTTAHVYSLVGPGFSRQFGLGTAFHVSVQSFLCRSTVLAFKELGTKMALKIGMGLQVGCQGANSIKFFVAKLANLLSSMLSQILKSMKTKTHF